MHVLLLGLKTTYGSIKVCKFLFIYMFCLVLWYNHIGDIMKVLLYTEGYKTISKSGLGKAIKHQMKALEDNKIEYTTDLKDDYDILHINFYGPKSYLYAKKMRKKGKKIVYHAHSTEEDFRNSFHFSNLVAPLFKKWLCKCYSLGDQIITPTEYSKRLLENYNLNRPIKAISNGVDTTFFERDEKSGSKFRRKYKYKKNDKVIVGIGLYIERKGIIDFVELAKRLPEYKFIWFGYSPLWASPRKIKRAVNTKLDNLTFAGYVESDMIKCALSGADLYLFPTLEETEGIPIIEALTSKIPTLIRDIPVFEEYEDKRHVYKAKDIDDFEVKIKQILEGELPDITEEGYKLAKKKDVKVVGKELIKTYKETLKLERVEEEKKTNYLYFRNLALILSIMLFFITILIGTSNFKNINITKLEKREYSKTFNALGEEITVKLYAMSDSNAEKALEEIEKLYTNYDKYISRNNNSELIYLKNNKEKDKYMPVSSELYSIIDYGKGLYDESNGLININTGILFDEELDRISKEDIDINNLELKDDNNVTNHVDLNLEYIKKGYTTWKAIKLLSLMNIDSYYISLGDYISVGNYYKDKGSYLINDKYKIVNKNVSIIDSNDNIINPNTLKKIDDKLSVTTICDIDVKCDYIASMIYMMSIDDAIKYVDENDKIDAIWVYKDDNDKLITTESKNISMYKQ